MRSRPGIAAGAAAGVLATLPMTVFMTTVHRRLPPGERDPLPPAKITARLEEKAGVDDDLTERQHTALTLVNHFGYGGLCGAVYGLAAQRVPAGVSTGVAFGLAVWAASYLGFLPPLGLHERATHEPVRRNAMMIGAHVVFGAALGVTLALATGASAASSRRSR
jgi:hypothetical protein